MGEPVRGRRRESRTASTRPPLRDALEHGVKVTGATLFVVDGCGVLQHDAQVVGQLGSSQLEPRREVGLLEPQQRHPPLAGVAVGEVGEEEVFDKPFIAVESYLKDRLKEFVVKLEVKQEEPDLDKTKTRH